MRKTLSLILICITLFFFVGCNIQIENNEYEYEQFYGVVRYSEQLNTIVVYNPCFGEVEIPDSDKISAFNDGEEVSYQLKHGDLINISFKYKKSYDDSGVSIMETYPARFDRKAYSITLLQENIEFDKKDQGYTFSFPATHEIESKEVGENLYFLRHKGYNGAMSLGLYATGVITAKTNGIFTVDLTFSDDANKFLDYYDNMYIEPEWSNP